MMTWFRRLDLAVLDHGYTPLAHWLHDLAGVRSQQIGIACIAGMAATIPMAADSLVWLIVGPVVILSTLSRETFSKPAPKIGCDNARRYTEQNERIWVRLLLLLQPTGDHLGAGALYVSSFLSVLYFGAVRERPRKPKPALAPASAAA